MPAASDSDKGRVYYVPCRYTPCSVQLDVPFFSTCLTFHIILNIVVGVVLVVFVPSEIMKPKASSATFSLFWSSAIIGAPFAFIFIVYNLAFVILFDHIFLYASIPCLLLLLLLITVELIVAILRSKRGGIAVPRCMGHCCSLCCCCCFCCCSTPGGRLHSRVARALALWFVMAWFQSIASSIVPVTIVVLSGSPVQMVAILAMVVSTFFSMVVFLAVLIHMCSQRDRSKHCILFMYSVFLVGILVMVCLAVMDYI